MEVTSRHQQVFMCIYMYTDAYTYLLYMSTCMWIYAYMCMYIYREIYTHVYIYIYTCINMYGGYGVYVYRCIYSYLASVAKGLLGTAGGRLCATYGRPPGLAPSCGR